MQFKTFTKFFCILVVSGILFWNGTNKPIGKVMEISILKFSAWGTQKLFK